MSEEQKKDVKTLDVTPKEVRDSAAEEVQRLRYKDRLQEALRHLKNVHAACELMALRLIDRNEPGDREMATILVINGFTHDLSKLRGIEWDWIHQDEDREKLVMAVRQHQATNEHHPEFWGGASLMPPVRIAEMVCDWFARSQEMGTDLRAWTKTAMTKYEIKPQSKLGREIKGFVNLLLDPAFKKLD